ncbi:MAG: hypothetical protein A2X25_06840 [Chloroflexi bacterium GWB2_49_20]|nr:MAG: hypothetical protein A2X25_06840 [Chloroflexi bacterium GWB2_49_20]OGN79090.1 MAG: hypothetical protein A2X26_09220 [Chloroflexi bacterium GWC2_49_37]HCC78009.1 hypothetical protein [Anaerolineae bacterium]HCM96638.1 hypothetical protein [Anaerolineae bacterium]
MTELHSRLRKVLGSLEEYARLGTGITLRPYQLQAANAIIASIQNNAGLSFVLVLPRQSGKDEMIGQLIAYLMRCLSSKDRSIVVVNPTYKPQTINAILRLETCLSRNPLTRGQWRKRSDFMRQVGYCRTSFLSGDGQANVVGATASLLLVINEAQDIAPDIYDKNFAPMCASTNATRLLCGTVWTSSTLLSREMRRARREQEEDGTQRLFLLDADQVALLHKPYGLFVQGEIARLGRQHPVIKTQFFNEEIDAQVGMFPEARQMLMLGTHSPQLEPSPGCLYAFLIDVGGQDEGLRQSQDMQNPGRDYTSLKIVEVDPCSIPEFKRPTYRCVRRLAWLGEKHTHIHAQIKALAQTWNPPHLVIDATGVGEGLFSMLDLSLPGRCIPVRFTQAGKSEIGYQFISIVETGRYREYHPFDSGFQRQLNHCQAEILPGPAHTMRWGVPDGKRDENGQPLHDDDLMTSALTAILDRQEWCLHSETTVIDNLDPLKIDRNF